MKKGGKGGANTTTGLLFELESDLCKIFQKTPGYQLKKEKDKAGILVYYNGKLLARCFRKNEFYKFLDENKIDYKKIISRLLYPDDSILVIVRETLFIIENKTQNVEGSVDEKLQTCDFKKKQYQKLVKPMGLKVEYVYVLSEWFKHPKYKDVLDYIESVNCHYVYNNVPLAWLGLPAS